MTDTPALRPGQADWETEMWTEALARFMVDGELDVPLLIPNELLDKG